MVKRFIFFYDVEIDKFDLIFKYDDMVLIDVSFINMLRCLRICLNILKDDNYYVVFYSMEFV